MWQSDSNNSIVDLISSNENSVNDLTGDDIDTFDMKNQQIQDSIYYKGNNLRIQISKRKNYRPFKAAFNCNVNLRNGIINEMQINEQNGCMEVGCIQNMLANEQIDKNQDKIRTSDYQTVAKARRRVVGL